MQKADQACFNSSSSNLTKGKKVCNMDKKLTKEMGHTFQLHDQMNDRVLQAEMSTKLKDKNVENELTSFLREHLKMGDPGFAIKSPS